MHKLATTLFPDEKTKQDRPSTSQDDSKPSPSKESPSKSEGAGKL